MRGPTQGQIQTNLLEKNRFRDRSIAGVIFCACLTDQCFDVHSVNERLTDLMGLIV